MPNSNPSFTIGCKYIVTYKCSDHSTFSWLTNESDISKITLPPNSPGREVVEVVSLKPFSQFGFDTTEIQISLGNITSLVELVHEYLGDIEYEERLVKLSSYSKEDAAKQLYFYQETNFHLTSVLADIQDKIERTSEMLKLNDLLARDFQENIKSIPHQSESL